jgi:L-histidine N-alpha-methyltransferase
VRQVHSIAAHTLADAISQGLSKEYKTLPSWLFYDASGDKLFQEIMKVPDYYLTRCEHEIIDRYKHDLLHYFSLAREPFQLIELGAGDGQKTEILLQYFTRQGAVFSYFPIDISSSALSQLISRLKKSLPGLNVQPLQGHYADTLQIIQSDEKKILLFLGANIGNFTPEEAEEFLRNIAHSLKEKDLAVIGFDLKKDPRIIAKAYDDSKRITREFNLNILRRLNNELGAQFVIHEFEHYPYYDPLTGAAKSFLISLRDQSVYIEALDRTFRFGQWEAIQTEISQKYDLLVIEKLLSRSGLEIVDVFFDARQYFSDVLVKKSNTVNR